MALRAGPRRVSARRVIIGGGHWCKGGEGGEEVRMHVACLWSRESEPPNWAVAMDRVESAMRGSAARGGFASRWRGEEAEKTTERGLDLTD